ncbi:MAG: ribonuclease H-like domain-containing protein [Promethearchaeota archaeon]
MVLLKMLVKTFRHLSGVGEVTERRIWASGYESWADALNRGSPPGVSPSKWTRYQRELGHHLPLLEDRDGPALASVVPSSLHWRMIPEFLGHIAYLDIETTGLYPGHDQITTIAVFDGKTVHDFVRGENLDEFGDFISEFPAVATYNGKTFDVPFIERTLGVDMPQVDFDTRFLLRRVGLTGGLKRVEEAVGLSRPGVDGIDGFGAVILWNLYEQSRRQEYLDTLLAYNNEDIINLPHLLALAYNGIVERGRMPFEHIPLPESKPANPREADAGVVEEVARLTGVRETRAQGDETKNNIKADFLCCPD